MSEKDDGEIPLLDADPLSKHQGQVGSKTPSLEEQSDPDERAIAIIIRKLEAKSKAAKSSHEELEDMAIEIYNRSCALVLGSSEAKHLEQLADLIEEDREALRARLLAAEEDSLEDGGGAAALLRALSEN